MAPARSSVRLLSVEETAHELNVSTKTIRRLIERGELRAHRVGRCIRLSADELRLYLSRNRA